MPLRIALAQDGSVPHSGLAAIFGAAGYQVAPCPDERSIQREVRLGCDLVLVDLASAPFDAVSFCRDLRDQGSDVPVMMLSERLTEGETVRALDAGADDYFVNQGHLPELLARVRAVLRRSGRLVKDEARIRVESESRQAYLDGRELRLSAKEFDLLQVLVRASGRVVTREQIMREVWQTEWFGATKTLDMHISWLRRKLGEVRGQPQFIITVRGVGFRFEPGQCIRENESAISPESKQGAQY